MLKIWVCSVVMSNFVPACSFLVCVANGLFAQLWLNLVSWSGLVWLCCCCCWSLWPPPLRQLDYSRVASFSLWRFFYFNFAQLHLSGIIRKANTLLGSPVSVLLLVVGFNQLRTWFLSIASAVPVQHCWQSTCLDASTRRGKRKENGPNWGDAGELQLQSGKSTTVVACKWPEKECGVAN